MRSSESYAYIKRRCVGDGVASGCRGVSSELGYPQERQERSMSAVGMRGICCAADRRRFSEGVPDGG